jgi:catechol 2,3-dioxygenase-like lactoylglutathione lyase family enzyme
MNLNQVTVAVDDFESSFKFYENLGLIPIVKSDHYARFIVPGNDATFSIHKKLDTFSDTVIYFECENLDEKVSELKEKGFEFIDELEDKPWLWREVHLKDPDGNHLCLYYAGENRLNPPWRIK